MQPGWAPVRALSLACRHLPLSLQSSHLSSEHSSEKETEREKEGKREKSFLPIIKLSTSLRDQRPLPDYLLKPHLQIQSHGGLGLGHTNFGRTQFSSLHPQGKPCVADISRPLWLFHPSLHSLPCDVPTMVPCA